MTNSPLKIWFAFRVSARLVGAGANSHSSQAPLIRSATEPTLSALLRTTTRVAQAVLVSAISEDCGIKVERFAFSGTGLHEGVGEMCQDPLQVTLIDGLERGEQGSGAV